MRVTGRGCFSIPFSLLRGVGKARLFKLGHFSLCSSHFAFRFADYAQDADDFCRTQQAKPARRGAQKVRRGNAWAARRAEAEILPGPAAGTGGMCANLSTKRGAPSPKAAIAKEYSWWMTERENTNGLVKPRGCGHAAE